MTDKTDAPAKTDTGTEIKDQKDILIEQLTARVAALEEVNKTTIADLTKANNDLWAYLHPANGAAVINKEPAKGKESAEPFDFQKAIMDRLKAPF